MALEHAILVSLAEKPATGYDLARRFDKSIGNFWKATHQQIYKVLARMESDAWVSSASIPQHGRPDKKTYAVAAAGREELRRWSRVPTPVEAIRSEFAVKVRGMPFGDRDAVLADITRQRDGHRDQLAYYLDNAGTHYPDPDRVHDADLPAYLVLQGGIRFERGQIAWCNEMLRAFGRAAADGQ